MFFVFVFIHFFEKAITLLNCRFKIILYTVTSAIFHCQRIDNSATRVNTNKKKVVQTNSSLRQLRSFATPAHNSDMITEY